QGTGPQERPRLLCLARRQGGQAGRARRAAGAGQPPAPAPDRQRPRARGRRRSGRRGPGRRGRDFRHGLCPLHGRPAAIRKSTRSRPAAIARRTKSGKPSPSKAVTSQREETEPMNGRSVTLKTLVAALAGLAAGSAHSAGFQLLEQNASGLGNAYAGSAANPENASIIYFNP